MKSLNNYSDEYYSLKDKVLKTINDFFNENNNIVIDVEEIEGCFITIVSFDYGKVDINQINSDGVVSNEVDTEIEFSDIAVCDLIEIIDVINDYIVDEEKLMDSCRD